MAALQNMAGKTFVARALPKLEEMSIELKGKIEEFVVDPNTPAYTTRPQDSWGLDVLLVHIKRIGTSKRVNVAIADKGVAIYKAQGERVRLEEEGAGRAEAERILLFARKEGAQKLAELVGTPEGLLVLQLEALERGLKDGKAVILQMDLSMLASAITNKLTTK